MTGWGGGDEGVQQRFIFYIQKNQTSEFVYPKKSLGPFFATKIIPVIFQD